jgi:hypothetical protein
MSDVITPVLSLKSLLVPSKAAEVEYPGLDGFKLNVCFLSRETLINIRKKATSITYKKHQPIEELDDDLFLKFYVAETVKGWSGFKLAYLEKLAPVELAGQNLEAELEYSADNALFLMKNSSDFDSFISEIVTELANFTKASASA